MASVRGPGLSRGAPPHKVFARRVGATAQFPNPSNSLQPRLPDRDALPRGPPQRVWTRGPDRKVRMDRHLHSPGARRTAPEGLPRMCTSGLQTRRSWSELMQGPGLERQRYCEPRRRQLRGRTWRSGRRWLHRPTRQQKMICEFLNEHCGRAFPCRRLHVRVSAVGKVAAPEEQACRMWW